MVIGDRIVAQRVLLHKELSVCTARARIIIPVEARVLPQGRFWSFLVILGQPGPEHRIRAVLTRHSVSQLILLLGILFHPRDQTLERAEGQIDPPDTSRRVMHTVFVPSTGSPGCVHGWVHGWYREEVVPGRVHQGRVVPLP